jgi:hypothetical protein
LIDNVLRGEDVLFARESAVEVAHSEDIEEHDKILGVGESVDHPLVDVSGVDKELYHEAEEEESDYVMSVAGVPNGLEE